MARNAARLRQLHRQVAPLALLPLLLTLITGSLFQVALLTGQSSNFSLAAGVASGQVWPGEFRVGLPLSQCLRAAGAGGHGRRALVAVAIAPSPLPVPRLDVGTTSGPQGAGAKILYRSCPRHPVVQAGNGALG